MISKPDFPYETLLGEYDGLAVYHVADEPSEWIDEDEFWRLNEEVAIIIADARTGVNTHAEGEYDPFEYIEEHVKKITPTLTIKEH